MRSRRWVENALRRGLYLFVLVILQRYLSPLVSIRSIFFWYGFGIAVSTVSGSLTSTRRKHLLSLFVGYGGTVGIIYGGIIGAASIVGPQSIDAMTSLVSLLPYTVFLPAIGGGIFVFLDAIAVYNDRIASLTGPGVVLLTVPIFWSQGFYRIEIFPHALWYVAAAAIVTVLVVVHQRIVSDRVTRVEPRGGRSGLIAIVVALLLIVSGVGYHLWSVGATAAGGGLLRPDVFHFDFSDYIRLESKISMSRDLVLLYREDNMPADRLLRRYVLSGYDPRRGFFRREDDDEPSVVAPPSLDAAIETLNASVPVGERSVTQEYYLLNLDPDALITVPTVRHIEVIPQWEGSSFLGSYRVTSQRPPGDEALLQSAPWPNAIDPAWREAYVGEEVPPAIAALAEEITVGYESLFGSIIAIENYLRDEYFYSLNPGVATDGDQLNHFLFESKKGYCSYFAFSMALMVRSLGVPARVSLGFFVDPTRSMIGFYPVRADMAHAWVEVWFPGAGWIEFDPTSQRIAPGEDIAFDGGTDFERLGTLVEEILQRRELTDAELPPRRPGPESVTQERSSTTAAVLLFLVVSAAGASAIRQWRWNRKIRVDPRGATEALFRRATQYARRREWFSLIVGSAPKTSVSRGTAPQRSTLTESVAAPQRATPPLDKIGVYVDRGRYAATYGTNDAIAAHHIFLVVFAGRARTVWQTTGEAGRPSAAKWPPTEERPQTAQRTPTAERPTGSSSPPLPGARSREWLRPLAEILTFVLVTLPSRFPRPSQYPGDSRGADRSRPAPPPGAHPTWSAREPAPPATHPARSTPSPPRTRPSRSAPAPAPARAPTRATLVAAAGSPFSYGSSSLSPAP
jgi:transglutaminase-like putative cysteine protease